MPHPAFRRALLSLALLLLPAVGRAQAPRGEEFRFTTSDGITVYGDLHLGWRGRAAPAVLLFHQGGGDARGEYREIVPELLRHGFTAVAVDARLGGSRFGGVNRTAAGLDSARYGFCDAYPDVAGALALADSLGLTGPRFLWGSSYTAALVIEAAARAPGRVAGVLAFSPASGPPLAGCEPERYLNDLRVPAFILRPRVEMAQERTREQLETFRRAGARTLVVENGVHGSSMLSRERINADPSFQWSRVLDFLQDHTLLLPEPPAAEERVTVESGGWTMVGDLARAGNAPAPAVLLLNQAAGDRDVYRALARLLASRGIHSLRLDLPGHGESTNLGTFVPGVPNAKVPGSARDVAAALAWLRGRPEVDRSRIGVVAGSYSGEFAAVAGREGARADAYVQLSPGSFSDSSAAWISPSGARWLFYRSADERFVRDWLDEMVRGGGERAEIRVVPGSLHASDILWGYPEVAEEVAEWLATVLGAGSPRKHGTHGRRTEGGWGVRGNGNGVGAVDPTFRVEEPWASFIILPMPSATGSSGRPSRCTGGWGRGSSNRAIRPAYAVSWSCGAYRTAAVSACRWNTGESSWPRDTSSTS